MANAEAARARRRRPEGPALRSGHAARRLRVGGRVPRAPTRREHRGRELSASGLFIGADAARFTNSDADFSRSGTQRHSISTAHAPPTRHRPSDGCVREPARLRSDVDPTRSTTSRGPLPLVRSLARRDRYRSDHLDGGPRPRSSRLDAIRATAGAVVPILRCRHRRRRRRARVRGGRASRRGIADSARGATSAMLRRAPR